MNFLTSLETISFSKISLIHGVSLHIIREVTQQFTPTLTKHLTQIRVSITTGDILRSFTVQGVSMEN
jgi:hypothetical protein